VLQKIEQEKASASDDLSDDEKHAAAVKSVSIKVEQGFQQATVALKQLGIPDSSVTGTVDQARAQVNTAINQLAAGQNTATPVAASPAPDTGNAPVSTDTTSTAVNAVNMRRSIATSLQLKTREGDVVTINFGRSQSAAAGSINTGGNTLAFASASASNQLEITVQGDLNKAESKSIQQVVKRVNKLAAELYSGETGEALEKLGKLNINTEQLAGLSLSMSSSISYQAVSAYSQVSSLPVNAAPSTTTNATPPVAAATNAGNTSASAPPVVTSNATSAAASGSTTAPQVSPAASSTIASASGSASAVSISSASTPSLPAAVTGASAAQNTATVVKDAVQSNAFEDPFDAVRNIFAALSDMFTSTENAVSHSQKDLIKGLFGDVVDKLEHKENDGDDDDKVNAVNSTTAASASANAVTGAPASTTSAAPAVNVAA